MGDSKTILSDCLYFTAGTLFRKLASMADDCFGPTGLNPSQGFALMCIVEAPGVTPTEIASRLGLATSTVSRMIDVLKRYEYVTVESSGRKVMATATELGEAQHQKVMEAWKKLYDRYSEKLGQDSGDELCQAIFRATEKLAE